MPMPGSSGPPRTADGEAFRFRSGRPSLDLCSTLLWRHISPLEQLDSGAAAARWLMAAGLCDSLERVSLAQAGQLRRLREACYGLLQCHLASRAPTADDRTVVNRSARRPTRTPKLDAAGKLAWWSIRPYEAATSEIARDLMDVISGPHSGRLRECAAPDCAFLFLDTSRPGNRRWCAANRCGNREHVRTHRRRAAFQATDERA